MSSPLDAAEEGGSKAGNLRRMAEAGLPVPPFAVVPATVFQAFLAAIGPPTTAARIRAADWPAPLRDTVAGLLATLPASPPRLAVRSSMAGEDGARHSFAGQLDSLLDVPRGADGDDQAVLAAIQTCWASAFSERVRAYRAGRGLAAAADPASANAMEVILQSMVDATCAGVLFTADPVTGSRGTMVVSVASGHGAALAQGVVAGETLRLDRTTGSIQTPARLLTPRQAQALWELAGEVERLFGAPQDLEFAFAGDALALLQARPITTPLADVAPGATDLPTSGMPEGSATSSPATHRILWDNANIPESYAGVTSPLTFTVIRRAYAGVYRQFLALMGVPEVDDQVLRNLLGYYHGQVYYQLENWYAALAMLPAFEQNRAFMEQMMGVKQSAGADTPRRPGSRRRLLRWGLRMLHLNRRRPDLVAAFQADVGATLDNLGRRDLDGLSPHDLHLLFLELEARVLGRWQAPIVTDFFAMVFFGLLRRLSERWLPAAPLVHNDLLAADGAIESLAPVARIADMAATVRASPALTSLFAQPDDAVLAALRDDAGLGALAAAFDDYLRRYGDRCMNELKLEAPNLRDDPARLVRLIRSATRWPEARTTGTAATRRTSAEAALGRLGWWRRGIYGWVLRNARSTVRDRENLRLTRSRVFGQLRRLFGAVGQRYAAAGWIDMPADVFYLTLDEVWDMVTGTATTLDLRRLVALRRAEHAAFALERWPERFETLGLPYLDPPRPLLSPAGSAGPATASAGFAAVGAADLRGTGCCAGRVTGRVRVANSVDELLDAGGDVLVAERTDPGWVFVFPTAVALLVERGSPLSHSAIVARELGLPTVVNIPGLTAVLATGDIVELDGRTGEVWLRQRAGDG